MTLATANPYVLSGDTLDTLFREARTANTFTDEPVDPAQLEAIYELTKLGPTQANSQPLRIVFLTNDEAKARLLPHMAEGNRGKTGTAPVVAILAADGDFNERMPELFPHAPESKDWFGDADSRAGVARFNAAIQLGYFVIAARSVGLAAGPMNGFDADGIDGEFFAGTARKVVAVVNLGKPGENAWFDRLPRLSWDDAVTVL